MKIHSVKKHKNQKKTYKNKKTQKKYKTTKTKKCRPMHNGYSSCRTVSWGHFGDLKFYLNPHRIK